MSRCVIMFVLNSVGELQDAYCFL